MPGDQSTFSIDQLAIHLGKSQTSTIHEDKCLYYDLVDFRDSAYYGRARTWTYLFRYTMRLKGPEDVRSRIAVFRKFEISCEYCTTCQLILKKLIL